MRRVFVPPYEQPADVPDIGLRCLPGRIAAISQTGTARGSVLLADKYKFQPDTAVVADSGVSGVDVGDVCLFYPGHGKFMDSEFGEIRLFGVVCPWWHSMIAKVSEQGLAPGPGWTLIDRDVKAQGLVHTIKEDVLWTGTVVSDNTDQPSMAGERVVLLPDDYEIVCFERPYPQSLIAVRPRHSQAASRGWLRSLDKVHV